MSCQKTDSQPQEVQEEQLENVFICENGKVVDLTVPDDNVVATRGIGSWFRCVKQQYTTMMKVIDDDRELSLIRDVSNFLDGGLPVVEAEVAVSAGIWCAK